ncbi:N-acetylmuramidase domain-containing protein [Bradyrhizobium erythrophlei]|uniref:Putative peptidoglycan binding domain-containing protein n=1 Tax=Bradyrhizobium erythrophlei TaxID=1437360 RepID=A0A1M5PXZ5_9BRAD|nr:N-acetylmuramidase domain-containing protein [Bradyrhizobium erythrophlei]SHH06725.1 Putative peptidoglycan binding domain-containing protein [Bradyrhizobium erythrophlei]
MFSQEIIDAIMAAAKAQGWPESSLLAVVECETSGQPFEVDGHTPTLLFERHKFYSEMQKHQPSKLSKAIAAGLAIKTWSPKTQYKDEGTSANRVKLIAKAREIDEEVANRAASWGLGQTMGFNAEELKYASATAMVAELSKGIAEQIEALVREIKANHLDGYLKEKNFAAFAKGYNGAGYKQNNYDVKMRNADAAWEKRIANGDMQAKPAKSVTLVYQAKLKALNYQVGTVDGDWGDLTTGACSAFQRKQGLKITGHPDDETTAALDKATPDQARQVSQERANATAEDLKAKGSKTIAAAQKGSGVTKVLIATGAIGGAAQTGALHKAKVAVGNATGAHSFLDSVRDVAVHAAHYWWVGLIVAGVVILGCYGKVIEARLLDHQTGNNIGK